MSAPLNSSAALMTMKAGLPIRSWAFAVARGLRGRRYCPSLASAVSTRASVGLSELREYPSCLGEMLNRERAPFFGLVQEAKDHLRTAYVLTGAIEKRIFHHPLRQGANA